MTISNSPKNPVPVDETKPVSNSVWVIFSSILLAVDLFFCAGYAFLSVNQFAWPFPILSLLFGLSALLAIPAIRMSRKGNLPVRQFGFISAVLGAAGLVQAALIVGTGLPTAIIYLLYCLILTSILSVSRTGTLTILLGLITAAAISLVGALSPYAIWKIPLFPIILWSLVGAILITFIFMLFTQKIFLTLQVRLTTAFIAIVVFSVSAGTIIQNQIIIRELRSNTSSNVLITAKQVATNLDKFLDTTGKAVEQEALLDPIYRYLEVRANGLEGTTELQEIKTTFRLLQVRETSERVFLSSYALLDKNGVNIFDTTEANIGLSEGNTEYFRKPFETGNPFVSDVTFASTGYSYVYFAAPVRDLKRQIIGVLRVRYNALVFQRLLETYSGLLGINSHAMLFDDYQLRLADTYTPSLVYSTSTALTPEQTAALSAQNRLPTRPDMQKSADQPALALALKNSESNPSFSMDLDPVDPQQTTDPLQEIGGMVQMAQKPWKIVYLQANFDDTSIRANQIRIATIIATLLSVLVGFVSVGLANILSAPIHNLTETAESIARGDLSAKAKVVGNDEFGTLGRAFNQMTSQLTTFISGLEDRVFQRTQEIARQNEDLTLRSRQLQTVAEVARGIVTSQDLFPLLDSVTRLISERFNFYHVGIFLIDANREFAVLRAANSEGGQRMLGRNHRLGVGKTGIVGYVTGYGQARIATDVGEDSVFFNNPDLPITRSEMALPLKVGDEIIGALDVQSTQSNAFSSSDMNLFSTLADQVAIAIHNNRLFTETAAALTEAQNLHKQYLRQEWSRELVARTTRGIQYTPQGLVARDVDLHDVENILQTGEPTIFTEELEDHSIRSVMAVPITLRGEPIGVIRVQDNIENRAWSEDEFTAVREVAQQVSVALEAARLLEQTVHRAEREKKVMEISGLIRSTNDPQQMLEIAASELQKALGATRAQIFIRNPTKPLTGLPGGGNGHNNHASRPDVQSEEQG